MANFPSKFKYFPLTYSRFHHKVKEKQLVCITDTVQLVDKETNIFSLFKN